MNVSVTRRTIDSAHASLPRLLALARVVLPRYRNVDVGEAIQILLTEAARNGIDDSVTRFLLLHSCDLAARVASSDDVIGSLATSGVRSVRELEQLVEMPDDPLVRCDCGAACLAQRPRSMRTIVALLALHACWEHAHDAERVHPINGQIVARASGKRAASAQTSWSQIVTARDDVVMHERAADERGARALLDEWCNVDGAVVRRALSALGACSASKAVLAVSFML